MWLSLVTCSYILLTENDDVGNFPVHTMHEITSETPLTSIRPHVGWEQCSPTAHKLYSLRHTTKEINWKWNTSNCKKPSATAHYQMSWSQRPWTSCPAQCMLSRDDSCVWLTYSTAYNRLTVRFFPRNFNVAWGWCALSAVMQSPCLIVAFTSTTLDNGKNWFISLCAVLPTSEVPDSSRTPLESWRWSADPARWHHSDSRSNRTTCSCFCGAAQLLWCSSRQASSRPAQYVCVYTGLYNCYFSHGLSKSKNANKLRILLF